MKIKRGETVIHRPTGRYVLVVEKARKISIRRTGTVNGRNVKIVDIYIVEFLDDGKRCMVEQNDLTRP